MSKGNVRGWEKTPKAGKSVSDGSSSSSNNNKNIKTIGEFILNLSEKNSAMHRAGFLHFLQAVVGNNVEANLNNGNKINGIFHTATPFQGMDFQFALKGCKNVDGKEIKDSDLGSTVILPSSNVSHLTISGKVELNKSGGSGELRTDGAIRGASIKHLEGRELQAATSWLGAETSATMGNVNSKGPAWNQFDANRKLFNVQSSYDENIYTKKLDKNSFSKAEIDKADRLAREIESTLSDNIHLKEERNQQQERDIDEEDMYGGVIKDTEVSGVWTRGLSNKITSDKKQANNKEKVKKDDKTSNKTNSNALPPGISLSVEEGKISDVAIVVEKDNKIVEELSNKKEEIKEEVVKTTTKLNPSAVEFKPSVPPPASPPVDNYIYPQQNHQNQLPMYMQQQYYNPQYPQIVPQDQHPVFASYGYAPVPPFMVPGGLPQMMYHVPQPLHPQHMMPMNQYVQQPLAPYMQHQNIGGGRGNSGRGGRGRGNQWQQPLNQGGLVPIPSGQTPPKYQAETSQIETDKK